MSPEKRLLQTQDMMFNIMKPCGLTLSKFQISTTLLVNSLKSLLEKGAKKYNPNKRDRHQAHSSKMERERERERSNVHGCVGSSEQRIHKKEEGKLQDEILTKDYLYFHHMCFVLSDLKCYESIPSKFQKSSL